MHHDDFIIYLKTVAYHLGGWRVDSRDSHRVFLMNDDFKLFARIGTYPASAAGRVFISASLPSGYNGSNQTPTISASLSRKPLAIANDIKRKVLPSLRKEMQSANESINKLKMQADKINNICHLIKNVGFTNLHNKYSSRGYLREFWATKKEIKLQIKVSDSYGCSIDASNLDHDQLIKLAYFINSL
jgi:hypothetical protein